MTSTIVSGFFSPYPVHDVEEGEEEGEWGCCPQGEEDGRGAGHAGKSMVMDDGHHPQMHHHAATTNNHVAWTFRV